MKSETNGDDTKPNACQTVRVDELKALEDITSSSLVELIKAKAPRKVITRVIKADDHLVKARALSRIDDEMGALRLIAAEEELVVAIFEVLKLHPDKMPEHREFAKKAKNHYVKLAFHPILQEFSGIVWRWLDSEMVVDGGAVEIPVKFEINADLSLAITLEAAGKEPVVLLQNPLHLSISHDEMNAKEIAAAIFDQLVKRIIASGHEDWRSFLKARAEYRNDLLYADDAGFKEMGEPLDAIIALVEPSLRDLLWALALLLAHEAPGEGWGLVSQFFAVYRRALEEAGIMKEEVLTDEGSGPQPAQPPRTRAPVGASPKRRLGVRRRRTA
jgi:hypothetical protein